MGQVVLFLDDKHEEKLRKLALRVYRKEKGAMSKIVRRGIDLVEDELKKEKGLKTLSELSDNARVLGIGSFKREEAYDR
ncbi:MAG: hypothetical protein HY392_02530 [Candidatus Diapherotrites archaeon]|nr:hypothetical protein [Candidatus Diapherotrites archaeon]